MSTGQRSSRWARVWLSLKERTPLLVVLLALGAFTLGAYQQAVQTRLAREQRASAVDGARRTACQARYNDLFALSLQEHSDLAQDDRDALRKLEAANHRLIAGVFLPPPGLTQQQRTERALRLFAAYQRASNQYTATEARLDQLRREHPYPRLPAQACR